MPLPTLTRSEFKKYATKIGSLASVMAGFTPTERDDAFVELVSHLFEDAEHFEKVCLILGIPPDPPQPS